jgi:hypothetical protein
MRGDGAGLATLKHNHTVKDSSVSSEEDLQIRRTDAQDGWYGRRQWKHEFRIVNKIYDSQFGLRGRAIHKTAIVYLG